MSSFRAGEEEVVSVTTPVTFLGLQIMQRPEGGFGITQSEFITALEEMYPEDMFLSKKFRLSEDQRKTRFRQALGSLL